MVADKITDILYIWITYCTCHNMSQFLFFCGVFKNLTFWQCFYYCCLFICFGLSRSKICLVTFTCKILNHRLWFWDLKKYIYKIRTKHKNSYLKKYRWGEAAEISREIYSWCFQSQTQQLANHTRRSCSCPWWKVKRHGVELCKWSQKGKYEP